MNSIRLFLIAATTVFTPPTSEAANPNRLTPEDTVRGFFCTGDKLKLEISLGRGPRGTDLTKITTPEEVHTYLSQYKKSITPHSRWGFAHHFESAGKIVIEIEFQGPQLMPNGEFGYSARAILGQLGDTILSCTARL